MENAHLADTAPLGIEMRHQIFYSFFLEREDMVRSYAFQISAALKDVAHVSLERTEVELSPVQVKTVSLIDEGLAPCHIDEVDAAADDQDIGLPPQ